jgi:hypothetical protein
MTEEITTAMTPAIQPEVVDNEIDIYDRNGIVLYESYAEFIERAKGRLTQEGQSIVWTRWTLGAHVKAALDSATYGSCKMADLENDLGLKSKTLYACKTLFETYTREDMEEKVVPKNISFRALNYIARVDDPAKRDEYMEQVATGELNPEEIPKLERGEDPGGEGEGDGDDTGEGATSGVSGEEKTAEQKAAAAVRKAIGAVEAPLDLVLGSIQAAETALDNMDILAGDDELYERVQGELSEFQDKLTDLQPRTTSLAKRLGELV